MVQTNISERLHQIEAELKPFGARLVAVSKTHPPELIREAYDAGQRIFGENRVQEATAKQPELPEDIEWHLIGHLQTNKVKYIASFVAMIHGVDSLKLLQEIDKQGARNNRVIPCLLQFHIASEETKFGLNEAEARELLESKEYAAMRHISVQGVMGMASFTDDKNKVRNEFRHLKQTFDTLRQGYFSNTDAFREISMGMSGDYRIALEEGSTMVRIGSAIFGQR
ncbi:MAG: YggS family pyridoxal phosphate-dependent enzyme [Flavobacteriales bacterium]|nr:YggS family pyridoxal phosphate-dependent enzyme [Flavobacteriales bacterium]MCB9447846.1 YggS family pyridoxal phosphate-dependent enzyme [Flavobacteriales bacterium]